MVARLLVESMEHDYQMKVPKWRRSVCGWYAAQSAHCCVTWDCALCSQAHVCFQLQFLSNLLVSLEACNSRYAGHRLCKSRSLDRIATYCTSLVLEDAEGIAKHAVDILSAADSHSGVCSNIITLW